MQITQQGQATGLGFWGQVRASLVTFGRGIVAVLHYIFFFVWVVDFARWLVTTGGNIAESAFLLATVYVTINTVAHELVAWLLPGNVILTVNQISVIAFSVLPELIVFSAIKVTFDHFKMAHSSKRLDAWVWAILYTLPTVVFLILTIVTISSFVSVEASTSNAPQATGAMLVTRCLAGWSYGMLQMLWVRLGHEGYSNLFARLRAEIVDLVTVVAARDGSITNLEQVKTDLEARVSWLVATVASRDAAVLDLEQNKGTLQAQIVSLENGLKVRDASLAGLQQELEKLSNVQEELQKRDLSLSSLQRELQKRDSSALDLQQDKANLQSQIATLSNSLSARDSSALDLQQDKAGLQSQIAKLNAEIVTRGSSITALREELEELKEQNATLDSELVEARIALARRPGAAGSEADGEESISEAVVNSEKYQKVKMLMQQQLTGGQKINMKKISLDTGIGYNTVRRYAQSILNGLVDRKSA